MLPELLLVPDDLLIVPELLLCPEDLLIDGDGLDDLVVGPRWVELTLGLALPFDLMVLLERFKVLPELFSLEIPSRDLVVLVDLLIILPSEPIRFLLRPSRVNVLFLFLEKSLLLRLVISLFLPRVEEEDLLPVL